MSDGITLNPGSGGSVCATDDVGGDHYQRVKVSPGGDGEAAYAATPAKYICSAAANQDAHAFKSAAGVLYSLVVTNSNAAARYLKLYDSTAPTSASTPHSTYYLPPEAGIAITFPMGQVHATGISMRATTGVADNDANAVTADDVVVNVSYV